MKKSRVVQSVVGACAIAAATLSFPATAAAHHRELTPLVVTQSLGRDLSLPCAGQMTGDVYTPHDRPGIAIVTISWRTFFTSPCSITAFVNFANTDNATGGTMLMPLTYTDGAPQSSWTGQIAVPVGSGNGSLTVTTDSPLNTSLLNPSLFTTRFVVA